MILEKRMINNLWNTVIVLALGILWASESLLGKITIDRGYSSFDFPLFLTLGTVLFIIFCCLNPHYRIRILKINKETLIVLLLTSVTLIFIPYLIIYLSLQVITPAETSLFSSLTPLFSLMISVVWLKNSFSKHNLSGVIVGLVGVAMLIVPQIGDAGQKEKVAWYLMMLLVPLSYAISGYLLKKTAQLNISYLQLLLFTNTISFVLFLALNGGFIVPSRTSLADIPYFLLGVLFNISALSLMLYLAKSIPPLILSLSNYATVIFSFVFTALYLGNYMNANIIISMVMILFSSLLVQNEKKNNLYHE